jgi:N-acetylglucosamine-6-sulfatase
MHRSRRIAARIGTGVPFVLVAFLVVSTGTRAPAESRPNGLQTDPPNIVLILTDDQRWDMLWPMPVVQSELVSKGITFTNGFVVRSACCPSRASILTGQYSHTTGIYTDRPPHGGFQMFRDESTIATWLHDGGYRTSLMGKYLTGYTDWTYIPPGWDRWVTFTKGNPSDNWFYYDYHLSVDGAVVTHGAEPEDYSTDVLAGEADSFIRSTDPAQPLFLLFAPFGVHGPARPAPRHVGEFGDLARHRPANFNETDMSDKPAWAQGMASLSQARQNRIDRLRLNQHRALLSVDEAVGTILTALADVERLSNTLIVFMSDNGYMWGEHRWDGKVLAYEESIRVPFVMRFDRRIGSARADTHMVANIDLAPTFAQAAGVSAPGVEGLSLLPIVDSPEAPWRTDLLIEHYGAPFPSFCAVRDEDTTYVSYATGEEELYDLVLDPNQLDNMASDARYSSELEALRLRVDELCQPTPPGYGEAGWARPGPAGSASP